MSNPYPQYMKERNDDWTKRKKFLTYNKKDRASDGLPLSLRDYNGPPTPLKVLSREEILRLYPGTPISTAKV